VQLQGTTLEGNALEELQNAAQADAGLLFVEADGTITFRSRTDALRQPAQSVSQVTFSDSTLVGQIPGLPYQDLTMVYDEATLINIAQVSRAGDGAPVYEARDDASVAKYLPATYSRTDLPFAGDGDALAYAQMIVVTSAKPDLRMTELTLLPMRDPDRLFPQALGRRIGDRITVVRNPLPLAAGTPIVRECFIRGITHEGSPRAWKTTWQLSTALPTGYMILDSLLHGHLDTDRLY
jgi:hypothetical protein